MSHPKINITNGPGGKFVSVDSAQLDESMKLFAEQEMAGIHISAFGAYKAKDVEFLREHVDISSVRVSEAEGIDLTALTYLSKLRHLTLDNYDSPVPLCQFRELETFAGRWSEDLQLGPDCSHLKSLSLRNYKAKDLTPFPYLPALECLELIQPSIVTLDGIESQVQIRNLTFHRCSKLVSIDAIAGLSDGNLEQLSFERCRKIASFEILGQLSRVKGINLQYCPDLHSLDFLNGCRELEGFGFFGTKYPEGDMTPLLSLPKLTFVGMSDKRHHSHKNDDLNALLAMKKAGQQSKPAEG